MGERFRERSEYQRTEPGEELRTELSNLVNRLRTEDDPLAREIAEKIAIKLEVKDMASRVADHLGDTTGVYGLRGRDDMVLCGIFVLRKTQAQLDWQFPQEGVNLHQGETFLDIHLPPQNADTWGAQKIQESLQLMAKYIAADPEPPRYIVGISYDAIINRGWIRKAGFSVIQPNPSLIPEDVRISLQHFFQGSPEISERLRPKINRIAMCVMPTEAFVARWKQ